MDQETFWNGEGGERWVREQARLDRALDPLGREALAAARVAPGERVLDVGCGCGSTTLALAHAVGTAGEVVGVDLSAPMLDQARGRAAAAGFGHVTFVRADAGEYRAARPFDLLFSRFGVMFFEDPKLAFANLLAALRPGGRLAFVCWRAMAENPWMTVPLAAVLPLVPPPEPTPPDAPGPFAFADRARVASILTAAGFAHVDITSRDVPLATGPLDEALEYAMITGPTARLAQNVDAKTREKMHAAVREALRPLETKDGVVLAAAQWIVTAQRPA